MQHQSVSVLDVLDNVGVHSPLEIGALTSKVIVIFLRRSNASVRGGSLADHSLHLASDGCCSWQEDDLAVG